MAQTIYQVTPPRDVNLPELERAFDELNRYLQDISSYGITEGTIGGHTITTNIIQSNSIILDSDNEQISIGDLTLSGSDSQINLQEGIIIDGENQLIRTNNFVSGKTGWQIGTDEAEFNNLVCRGKLTAVVFEQNTVSAIGGKVILSESDTVGTQVASVMGDTLTLMPTLNLHEDHNLGSGPYVTFIVSNDAFDINMVIRLKDGTDDEYLQVKSVTDAPTYYCSRDLSAAYTGGPYPTWSEGTAVTNLCAPGEGYIVLDSFSANSPFIQVFKRESATYDDVTEKIRIGNLNGIFDYSTDTYGIAIGEDSSSSYLVFDGTNLKMGPESQIVATDAYGNDTVYWSTMFDSIDMFTNSTTGTGSTTLGSGFLRVSTGATNGSTVHLSRPAFYGIVDLSWNYNRRLKLSVRFLTNSDQEIYLVTGEYDHSTNYGFGFKVVDNTLYGYLGKSGSPDYLTTETYTISTASNYVLEAVFIVGTGIDYYVEGSLLGSLTSNLPTGVGGNKLLDVYIENTAASDKYFDLGQWKVMQED